MKPNPNFDEPTSQWWRLTKKHVAGYAKNAKVYGKSPGEWGAYGRRERSRLKELCKTRREVHRAGTSDLS